MLLGTVLHEGAHALAVVLLGGSVESLVLLPRVSAEGVIFGSVWHRGVPDDQTWWVSVAPFIAAHGHALAGCLVVARSGARWVRLLFFTSVLLPLFDLSLLHAGLYVKSDRADLHRFASHWASFALLGGPVLLGLCVLAFRAFRRHWGTSPGEGLTAGAFAVLLALFLGSAWLT